LPMPPGSSFFRCLEKVLFPSRCVLDVVVAIVLVNLPGHWEFLPVFAAELLPGLDLVPFWTMSVITYIGNGSS